MIKLKYQLATLATAALAGQAYAQPVVPDESQAPTCPTPQNANCPQPTSSSAGASAGAGVQTPAGGASAQGNVGAQPGQPLQQPSGYTPPPPPPPEGTYVEQEKPWWDRQFAISVGGGVDDFVQSNAKALTSTGGSWDARLSMGVHSYVGAEVSYIGSAQTLKMNGASQTLYGNGAQGVVRLNLLPDLWITPFGYGGAAWRYYSTSGGPFGNSHDDKLEVPLGGGIAAYVADLMFDVRGEYRIAPNSEHASGPGVEAISGNFDRWGVTGNIGAVF